MTFTFSWKRGLLTALVFIIVGVGFFAFVGSKIDAACLPIGYGVGCHAWKTVHEVTTAYGSFWLQFFAPRCVGDSTPDDCIGPAIGVMFWTLAVSGLLIGGFSRRNNKAVATS